MSIGGYILIVAWEVPNMPKHIGPFDSRAEADDFARINVPNGTWEVVALAYPYLRAGRAER